MKFSSFKVIALLCALTLLAVSGCGLKKPAGFPEVESCTVTVTDNGKPLSQASVVLNPEDVMSAGSYTSAGTTDKNGVAVIRTMWGTYSEKGVPAGNYKVTLMHVKEVTETLTKEQKREMTPGEYMEYKSQIIAEREALGEAVPEPLRNLGTTPLTISVPAGGTTMSIEMNDYRTEETEE